MCPIMLKHIFYFLSFGTQLPLDSQQEMNFWLCEERKIHLKGSFLPCTQICYEVIKARCTQETFFGSVSLWLRPRFPVGKDHAVTLMLFWEQMCCGGNWVFTLRGLCLARISLDHDDLEATQYREVGEKKKKK